MECYCRDTARDVVILSAEEGLDGRNAEPFGGELARLVEAGANRLVVDGIQRSHISNRGVGILIRSHERLAERGAEVELAAVDNPVVRILRRLSLDTVVQIYPDLAATQRDPTDSSFPRRTFQPRIATTHSLCGQVVFLAQGLDRSAAASGVGVDGDRSRPAPEHCPRRA